MGIMSWDLDGGFSASLPLYKPRLTVRCEDPVDSESEGRSTDHGVPRRPDPRGRELFRGSAFLAAVKRRHFVAGAGNPTGLVRSLLHNVLASR